MDRIILVCGDVARAGWIALKAIVSSTSASRAEIKGSREGAKPRSCDKKRIIFARAIGPRRRGHSQAKAIRCRKPPSARRVRMHGRARSGGRGPGGPEGQEELDSCEGGFFVSWI